MDIKAKNIFACSLIQYLSGISHGQACARSWGSRRMKHINDSCLRQSSLPNGHTFAP